MPPLSYQWFATALFGWALSSLSQYLLALRGRREAISKALSDLLEIRHQFLAVDRALDEIRKVVQIPPEMETQFRVILEQRVLPDSTVLSKRYDESVSLVSAMDPILGYRLRSKDLMGPLLQRLNALAVNDTQASALGQKMTKMLVPHVDVELVRSIKSLSWRRGPITRWRIGRVLNAAQFPKEVSELLGLIQEEAAKQRNVSQPGVAPSHSA
jgi:hypothetical protein